MAINLEKTGKYQEKEREIEKEKRRRSHSLLFLGGDFTFFDVHAIGPVLLHHFDDFVCGLLEF